MFEYLMPLLVMPTFANTLLDQTAHAAVKRQIQYGNQRGVPWGISECGYNTVDAALNYQYRAFGVPGLGLQRGLAEDLVIAPYASALALMIKPREACSNLQRAIRSCEPAPWPELSTQRPAACPPPAARTSSLVSPTVAQPLALPRSAAVQPRHDEARGEEHHHRPVRLEQGVLPSEGAERHQRGVGHALAT